MVFIDFTANKVITLLHNLQRHTKTARVRSARAKTTFPTAPMSPHSPRSHSALTLTPCRVLKLADKPSDLGGGDHRTKFIRQLSDKPNCSVEVRLLPLQQKTARVRSARAKTRHFPLPSPHSPRSHSALTLTPCRVLKLADKPSDLGGGDHRTKFIRQLSDKPNCSVEVRLLPLQQKTAQVRSAGAKTIFPAPMPTLPALTLRTHTDYCGC